MYLYRKSIDKAETRKLFRTGLFDCTAREQQKKSCCGNVSHELTTLSSTRTEDGKKKKNNKGKQKRKLIMLHLEHLSMVLASNLDVKKTQRPKKEHHNTCGGWKWQCGCCVNALSRVLGYELQLLWLLMEWYLLDKIFPVLIENILWNHSKYISEQFHGIQ